MADGHWLVVNARAFRGESNAWLYRPSGVLDRVIALGDAVANVACSPDGTIWLGYFDEGALSGAWPSTGGIVNFDANGTALWSLNDAGTDSDSVDDCYALSLTGDVLWTCYYSNFPIVRVANRLATSWRNAVNGVKALAARDDTVLLGGGYAEEANLVRIVKLRVDGRAPVVAHLRFSEADPDLASRMQGRNGVLHVVRDGIWHKLGTETFASGRALSDRVRRSRIESG